MKESINTLKENKRMILEKWMQIQLTEEGLKDELMSNEYQRIQSEELLDVLIHAVSQTNMSDPSSRDFDAVHDVISDISISRAKQGFSPRETSVYVFGLKEAILTTLSENLTDKEELYAGSISISRIFDGLSVSTFESFIKGREEVILRQTDEITEISTPVIRVWDGILALPIIGTLDSSRTQVVMENLLQEIVDTGSVIAILDISGVPAVDSLVAQHLIKTVGATRLMGAECIISGIRPEIAQTVVHLGIDLSNIITKATLASALKTAFSMLQLQVVTNQKITNSSLR
jgi:rsbT co-antagonist protein RsbR